MACEENHLAGMTGRGAPHVFAFDRRGELPGLGEIVFKFKRVGRLYCAQWGLIASLLVR